MNMRSFVPRGSRHALLVLLAGLISPPLLPADDMPPKDHAIFVGLDVAIHRKGKFHRVVGAQKDAVQILTGQTLMTVPLKEIDSVRVNRGTKLSNLTATIGKLNGTRENSRAAGFAEFEATSGAMAVQDEIAANRDYVLGNAIFLGLTQAANDPNRARSANSPMESALAQLPAIDDAARRMADAGNKMINQEYGASLPLNVTGFEVSYEISAPKKIEQAHTVIVVDYTLPGKSEITLSSISVQPIRTISQKKRKVTRRLNGFPVGATLKGYQVAIYSHGQEIATNLSSHRMDVTRDEAVLFITTDYLTKHPDETRPPVPVLMVPRSEFIAQLGSAPLDQIIYARIGRDGKITRLSTDANGSAELPADLAAAVGPIAFVPALEKGKPVEGVAKLKLADLVARN